MGEPDNDNDDDDACRCCVIGEDNDDEADVDKGPVGGAASTEAMASTKVPPRPLPAKSRPSNGPAAAALRISDLKEMKMTSTMKMTTMM